MKPYPFFLYVLLFHSALFGQTVQISYYLNTFPEVRLQEGDARYQQEADYNWYTYQLEYSKGISELKNDDFSVYLERKLETVDSVMNANGRFDKNYYSRVLNQNILDAKAKYIYKDHLNTKFHTVIIQDGKPIHVADDFLMMEFEMREEVKEILGYTCRKAVVKRQGKEVIYWFTEDLGFAVNPDLREGIPGVVLEIQGFTYHCLAFQVQNSTNTRLISPPQWSGPVYSYPEGLKILSKRKPSVTQK